ncbi:cation-transporting P-type ATPase [Streptomyces olivaceoviridis]|uniref:cation-transporting P-type ATPase n=1 Tax=Streptomyces olivaceoviridis TaxID=1921 RepID=UPI0036FC1AF1
MSPEPERRGTAVLRAGGPPTGVTATVPPPGRRDASGSSVPLLPVPDVLAALGSSVRGLTPAETAARLDRYGPNELPGARRGRVWRRLVARFTAARVPQSGSMYGRRKTGA